MEGENPCGAPVGPFSSIFPHFSQGQFNNLMLASILMFGVSMSAIIEGNFDITESQLCVLLFSTFEAVALSMLFLTLVSCLLVSRRMSVYMITRTGKLVERLSFIIKSADMLAADASGISSLPSPVIYRVPSALILRRTQPACTQSRARRQAWLG